MDFIDEIKTLAGAVPKLRDRLKTEEATKQSLVLPFIKTLGYNIFDPSEVVPEFSADFGTAISDKVDYAIFIEDRPVFLFECIPSRNLRA
jgi:predicted type IV restriction endonuclease